MSVCPQGGAWSWGVPGPEGGCLILGGVWSRGGSGPGGCLVPEGGVAGGDPPTATAAGGTHPTGMHSCDVVVLLKLHSKIFGTYINP